MTLKPSKIQNVIIFWTKAPGFPYILGWLSCIHNTFLMTGYSQMYKIISFLFPAFPSPHVWATGQREWDCEWWWYWGWVRGTEEEQKKRGVREERQGTCSSSCWTTCICTRHWAVLRSSSACSLFRCLEREGWGCGVWGKHDILQPTIKHLLKLSWWNPKLHYPHVQWDIHFFLRIGKGKMDPSVCILKWCKVNKSKSMCEKITFFKHKWVCLPVAWRKKKKKRSSIGIFQAVTIFMETYVLSKNNVLRENTDSEPCCTATHFPFPNANGIYLVWVVFLVNYVIEMNRN